MVSTNTNPGLEFLAQAEPHLPSVVWTRDLKTESEPPVSSHLAKFYQGVGGGYIWTLVSFSIEDQGFPPGSRGYDGVVAKDGTVCRMTRAFATQAAHYAEKAEATA